LLRLTFDIYTTQPHNRRHTPQCVESDYHDRSQQTKFKAEKTFVGLIGEEVKQLCTCGSNTQPQTP